MTTRNQRDLDELLGEEGGPLGALYGRLSKAQPPRRLDRQILAEASRAVHGRPRGPRWMLGLGTAAGVLLAAGIAWRVNVDLTRQRDSAVLSTPAVTPAAAPAPSVIPIQAHEAPASRASGSASITSKGFDGDSAHDVVATGSRTRAEPAAAAIEMKAAREAAKLHRAESLAKPAGDMGQRTVEAAAPPESEAVAPPPPPAPAPPSKASVTAAAPAPEKRADVEVGQSDAPQKTESSAEPARTRAAPQAAVAEPTDNAAAIGAIRDQARAALPDGEALLDASLLQIRRLLADGRRDAAITALRTWRREHPDRLLPDDLRALER